MKYVENDRLSRLISYRRPLAGLRERNWAAQRQPASRWLDNKKDTVSGLSELFSSLSGGPAEAVTIAQAAFAEAFPDSDIKLVRRLPRRAPILYDKRVKADYSDPIDFLIKVWGDYIQDGVLFLDDLNRLDPKLAPAITSYCQRKRADHNEDPAKFIARDHLPPTRRLTLDDLASADPDSPEGDLAKRIKANRERVAQYYQNRHG